jgi:hypothetical protein
MGHCHAMQDVLTHLSISYEDFYTQESIEVHLMHNMLTK